MILYFYFQVTCPLYDEVVYLNEHHKGKLRQEFGKDNRHQFQIVCALEFVPLSFCSTDEVADLQTSIHFVQ